MIDYLPKTQKNFICPNCHIEGKENFRKNGFQNLYQRKIQKWQCKRCGKIINENQLEKTIAQNTEPKKVKNNV